MGAVDEQAWEMPWRSTAAAGQGKAGAAPTYLYGRALETPTTPGPPAPAEQEGRGGKKGTCGLMKHQARRQVSAPASRD